jgi:hypothetical protein
MTYTPSVNLDPQTIATLDRLRAYYTGRLRFRRASASALVRRAVDCLSDFVSTLEPPEKTAGRALTRDEQDEACRFQLYRKARKPLSTTPARFELPPVKEDG